MLWSPNARTQDQLTIVADARLDNREELEPTLSGLDPDSDDTSAVSVAWRRWGVDCGAHLRGDFTFAIWDDQRRRLFCCRDLVGASTLYYWTPPGGGLAFASQLGGLLDHPDMARRLDATAAVDHLLFLHHDTGRTLFGDVHRLPPGHALTFSPGDRGLRTWRHTDFRQGSWRFASLDDWADGLRTEIHRAVRLRLRTSARIGAHVSGGLDSSAVTSVAASALANPHEALLAISFSANPDASIAGAGSVDADFILAMRDWHGLEIHHPESDHVHFEDALRLAAPGMMPPPYRTSSMHRWAAGLGVDTMLSGWGGDEASSFNGRSHLAELLRRGRLVSLARTTRRLRGGAGLRRAQRFVWSYAVLPQLPDGAAWWLARRRGDAPVHRLEGLAVNEAMARELGAEAHLRHQLRTRPTTRATQLALLHSGHLVERIEQWSADASRFGIEYRYPLLDQRVLEVALAAPSGAFLHEGVSRWLFRKAMEPYLPGQIAWRPDKKDSWTQQREVARGMGVGDAGTAWVIQRATRMVAEGEDLGGVVDLAKLRRSLSFLSASGYRPGRSLASRAPMIGTSLASSLAAFVEHNRISVG